jgi:cadmium resistance protein CadD (predicted permease)
MEAHLKLLGLAVVLFASTNIDDAFVLVGFFSNRGYRTGEIVVGQYAGMAVLVSLSVAASLLSSLIPRNCLGLLGIIPILIGISQLMEIGTSRQPDGESAKSHSAFSGHGRTATVALVTLANSGDNIGAYTPVFALHKHGGVAVMVIVFALLTAVWCFAARWIAHHPRFKVPMRRSGWFVSPVVLIGLGIAILYQSHSLTLLIKFWR